MFMSGSSRRACRNCCPANSGSANTCPKNSSRCANPRIQGLCLLVRSLLKGITCPQSAAQQPRINHVSSAASRRRFRGAFSPSRTLVLAEAILDELKTRLTLESHLIELGDIARQLGGALSRQELGPEVEAQIRAIENADLLIVATPVYRGSYPGLLKHLFDLVDINGLIDTPVLLAATGGSERHALVLEHQLRPLFGFFQALTLPIGVYAVESDFANYQITSEPLKTRIRLAAERAAPLFGVSARNLLKIA